jgi:putative iron-regulated protein
MKKILAILLAATALSTAHAKPVLTEKAVVQAHASLIENSYHAAWKEAAALQKAMQAFLKKPTDSTLNAVRQQWIKARQPYLQTEAFRFYGGPIEGKDGLPEGRMNAWPVNEAFIDYVRGNPNAGLVQDSKTPLTLKTILEKDQITDEADVTTGWHAIEFLLWGQDFSSTAPGNRPASDYIPGKETSDRRRQYLALVTQQLVDDLAMLNAAWAAGKDNYRKEFIATPQESLGNVLTALSTLSGFELASERLAVPLDSKSQEDEHSCFSDTTHQDYRFNQQGIANVWFGLPDSKEISPAALLQQKDAALADKVNKAVEETTRLAAAVPAPFDAVLVAPKDDERRKPVESLLTALEKQADLFVEAGKTLGVKAEILAE